MALFEAGQIDGALVAKPSADPDEPWKAVPTVVTTVAEIRAAAGSFYNQSMALAALDLTGKNLPANPRIAAVGTPCEVAGLRAMQSKRWPTGAHRVDAVILSIALLCTKSFSYEGLMHEELKQRRGIDLNRVSKVDVTRGRLIVEYRDGAIAVDEWSKTTADKIWAVGDVTDRINLTPVALMEGHCFADTEFGKKPRKANHHDVPSAVFCQPEMANVGLSEEQAKLQLGQLRIEFRLEAAVAAAVLGVVVIVVTLRSCCSLLSEEQQASCAGQRQQGDIHC